MVLRDCVSAWITRRELILAPSTISGYRRLLRLYIEPSPAGALELEKLDEDDMLELLRPLITAGHTRQAQLLQILVSAVLKDATRRRLVVCNVMDYVEKVRHKGRFTAWLCVEDARRFLGANRGTDWYLAWLLMVCCGLRRGEVLGLRWDDVDFQRATLRVERQLVRVDRKLMVTRTKSEASSREIPVDDRILSEMRLFRRPGRCIIEGGTPEAMAAALDAAIQRAGVPRVTPHGLRHTMAATAAGAGVPMKVLQTLLGHAHMSTTADIYAHVAQDSRRSAAATITGAAFPTRLEIA